MDVSSCRPIVRVVRVSINGNFLVDSLIQMASWQYIVILIFLEIILIVAYQVFVSLFFHLKQVPIIWDPRSKFPLQN